MVDEKNSFSDKYGWKIQKWKRGKIAIKNN